MKVFFSSKYKIDIGEHVFPTAKFAMAAELLKADGAELIEPKAPSRKELLLAHTEDWVDRVMKGQLTFKEQELMELRWSKELAEAHALSVSGTILACREALSAGLGLHCGGGSHHAFADHGEGFCVFNDIACGIIKMTQEGKLSRAMVVDLDVHQGNGTAGIFRDYPDIFTFSMHQAGIYPMPRTPGSLDIDLPAGMGDENYLRSLGKHLPRIIDKHQPQLVVYQAGVDVYEHDLLGGLKLTKEGILKRDKAVIDECVKRKIPLAVTLGGGYAKKLEDTAMLHAQTLRLAARLQSGV